MDRIVLAYEKLIQNFIEWAQDQEDIRAAVVIGSRARRDHPADEFADLDIGIFVVDPKPYLESAAWLENIGMPWLTFVEVTGDERNWERRALFEGGLDIDFAYIPLDQAKGMIEAGMPSDLADIFRRGYRFLLDKDGLEAQICLGDDISTSGPQPPTEHGFLEMVNDFWYHTVWTAKHLRRGELWWAKSCCDMYMKNLLRCMLEWHTRATRPGTDTWLRGRFLEEWADPRAVEALRRSFAHYDVEDVWRALFATIDLFRWLSLETAEELGYSYPTFGAERATELVQLLFDERSGKK